MRGIRIVTFALAVVSACILFSHVIGIDPWPEREHGVDLNQAGPPPEVPPPPPLPVQPTKKNAPAEVEDVEPLADALQPAPEAARPLEDWAADAKPVIWTGDVEVLSSASPAALATPAVRPAIQTASVAPRAAVPR
jgi:hypothetical protein